MEIKLAQRIRMSLLLDESFFSRLLGMLLCPVEGSRGELGSVAVFDLENLKLIDHANVGIIQAGGIAFC